MRDAATKANKAAPVVGPVMEVKTEGSKIVRVLEKILDAIVAVAAGAV